MKLVQHKLFQHKLVIIDVYQILGHTSGRSFQQFEEQLSETKREAGNAKRKKIRKNLSPLLV